jgi:ferredoxin, 2Fe-2S
MTTLSVTFKLAEGGDRKIEDAKVGWSLMETARANSVDGILADCGGSRACATCHVYIDPQWQEIVGRPDDDEAEVLDMVSEARRANSRLSCQITLRSELDGLIVTVAPESPA